jgi:hypothetical protein
VTVRFVHEGLPEVVRTDIPAAVDAILPAVPPGNPVPVTAANLEELLHRA